MNYVFKSVAELSAADIQQYLSLYNTTFGRGLSEEGFRYKFTRQMGPNAYFVLMVDDQAGIVGSLGAIEVPYTFNGEHYKFGLTVDAMINPAHRVDMLAMQRQHEVLFRELAHRGFACVFTKPNNNSYLYLKKLLGFSDIGELSAYGLPLRPFWAASRRLAWLDSPWLLAVRAVGRLARPRSALRPIALDEVQPEAVEALCVHRRKDPEFLRNRYGTDQYHCIGLGDRAVIYGIRCWGGRSVCCVLEAQSLRLGDWLAFALHVAANHREVVLIVRITGRRAACLPLLPIPHKLLPNKFRIVLKPIGACGPPADAEYRLELADFEVV